MNRQTTSLVLCLLMPVLTAVRASAVSKESGVPLAAQGEKLLASYEEELASLSPSRRQ